MGLPQEPWQLEASLTVRLGPVRVREVLTVMVPSYRRATAPCSTTGSKITTLDYISSLPCKAGFSRVDFWLSAKQLKEKTQNSRKKLKTQGKKINISAFFKYISKAYVSKAWLSKCECRTIEGTKKLENSREKLKNSAFFMPPICRKSGEKR